MFKHLFFILIMLLVPAVSLASVVSGLASNLGDILLSNPTIFVPLALAVMIMAIVKFSVGKQNYDNKNSNMLAVASGVATFLIVMLAVPESVMLEYSLYVFYMLIVALIVILVTIVIRYFKKGFGSDKLNKKWIFFILSILCIILGYVLSSTGAYELSGWFFVCGFLIFAIVFLAFLGGLLKKKD